MPESRDRLFREDPLTPMSRRRSIGGIWQDFEQERVFRFSNSRFSNDGGRNLFGSPLQLRPMAMPASGDVSIGRVGYRTPRFGSERGRNLFGNSSIEQENTSTRNARRGRGRGRGRNSPLPYWYPRTPLRDITAVVNAIDRRRIHLRDSEGHRLASSLVPELSVPGPSLPITGAPLKHVSLTSPSPTTLVIGCPLSLDDLSKIFLHNHVAGESFFLTPQKKLLNSIDKVEKVVMDEFRRMKKTPTAKKAEREKKVRTLMAMR